jgi:hypothetical protein
MNGLVVWIILSPRKDQVEEARTKVFIKHLNREQVGDNAGARWWVSYSCLTTYALAFT